MIQFQCHLESTNSRFRLVNVLLRKFDTSSKKETKMIKKFYDEKPKKKPKKYIKALSNIFL